MIIELVGLPGSGKSTLCDVMKEEALQHSIALKTPSGDIGINGRLTRIYKKSIYFFAGLIFCPLSFFKFISVVQKSRQNSFKDFVKNIYNGCFLLGLYWRFHKSKRVVLLDQG